MPGQIPTPPPLARRAGLYVRLIYKELQYWLIGLTPEHYHHYQAVIFSELLRFDAAIKHYRAYLKLTDDPRVRVDLGLLLGTVSRWSEALTEYERALIKWGHPAVRLAIAEAHLRLGNKAEASRLIGLVIVEDCHESEALRSARCELLSESAGDA
jgi:tetratricopeptide (TPR) repeat protein